MEVVLLLSAERDFQEAYSWVEEHRRGKEQFFLQDVDLRLEHLKRFPLMRRLYRADIAVCSSRDTLLVSSTLSSQTGLLFMRSPISVKQRSSRGVTHPFASRHRQNRGGEGFRHRRKWREGLRAGNRHLWRSWLAQWVAYDCKHPRRLPQHPCLLCGWNQNRSLTTLNNGLPHRHPPFRSRPRPKIPSPFSTQLPWQERCECDYGAPLNVVINAKYRAKNCAE